MNGYDKAYAHLKDLARAERLAYYEIAEDSYEYENGLILIAYEDAEHENEDWHVCVNIDDFKEPI